jgi:hypothetical protein
VESSCEFGIEPTGFHEMLGNYRVVSRVVLSSIELVSYERSGQGKKKERIASNGVTDIDPAINIPHNSQHFSSSGHDGAALCCGWRKCDGVRTRMCQTPKKVQIADFLDLHDSRPVCGGSRRIAAVSQPT